MTTITELSNEAFYAQAVLHQFFDCDASTDDALRALHVIKLEAEGKDPVLFDRAWRAFQVMLRYSLTKNDNMIPEVLQAIDDVESRMTRHIH